MVNQWTKVEDKQPNNYQEVLTYTTIPPGVPLTADARPLNRCFFEVLEFHKSHWDGKGFAFVDSSNYRRLHITHWMPLPEKPDANLN